MGKPKGIHWDSCRNRHDVFIAWCLSVRGQVFHYLHTLQAETTLLRWYQVRELSLHGLSRCQKKWTASWKPYRIVAPVRRQLIWIQLYKRQLNPKQRRRTYMMYLQSILDYQLLQSGQVSTKNNANNLPRLCTRENDSSSKHQQLLRAQFAVGKQIFFHVRNGTKYSWWIVITASEVKKKTNLPLQLCSMPSLIQLDPWVEVIHLSDTRYSLEQDQVQERDQTLRRRLWKNFAVKFLDRRAMQHLYQEAQIDGGAWEDIAREKRVLLWQLFSRT
jgi:hypothetical protein